MSPTIARYAGVSVGIVLVAGALFSLGFRGPGDAAAVWLSAGVALGVQALAVAVTKTAGRVHLTARMAAGMIVRLLAVIAYALIAAKLLLLPAVAALLSFATFLFLMTVIEPLLIKP